MASRSLGQLTIDLIAKIGGFTQGMTQAERVADQKSRDIKRKLDQHAKDIEGAWTGMAKMLAASFAGISVGSLLSGMVGVTKETAKAAAEIDRFATLSNTSAQGFQRLAYGAQTVGISGEKLADIFKDVQDKFGDFAQTGGGEMADFFEKIAPRVGVTIEQFRRLSGPDALQLYVSSLQKANLSQQDMVFYMEAVANDSTLLLPLLQNNGKAWKALGDEAQRTGAIMNDQTLAAAKAFQEEARKLDGALQGVRMEIADKLLPVLTEMNRNLADPSTQDGIRKTVGLLADMAAKVVQLSNEFFLGMKYADGFWDALFKYGATNPFKSSKDQLASLQQDLKQAQEDANTATIFKTEKQRENDAARIRSLQQQIGYWQARVNSDLDKENEFLLRNYRSRAPAVAPAAGPLSPVTPPKSPDSKGKSQAEKDREAADQYLRNLREQADQVKEMTSYEKLLYDLRTGTLKITDESRLKEAERLALQADFAKDGLKADEERKRLQEAGKRLTEQVRRPMEQLSAEQEHINFLYSAGVITIETQARALQQARVNAFGLAGEMEKWVRGDVDPLSGGLFDKQVERYQAEEQVEKQRYAAQLQRLQDLYGSRNELVAEQYLLEEQLAQEHAARMGQIEKAKSDLMLNNMAQGFGQMSQDLGEFAKQFGIKNKAMLATVKAAAIAQTVIQTYQSAQSAYAAMVGIPVVGPALGIAAAAAAVAGGLARVQAIRSQSVDYWTGGYTGHGGKYEPAGIVHRGEVVWSQADIARAGGVGVVEAMRRGARGYADGGIVAGPRLPNLTIPATALSSSDKGSVKVIIQEDASRAGQVDWSMSKFEEKVVRVFVSNVRRGGDAAMVIEQTFGSRRMGR